MDHLPEWDIEAEIGGQDQMTVDLKTGLATEEGDEAEDEVEEEDKEVEEITFNHPDEVEDHECLMTEGRLVAIGTKPGL